jgi:hypothetical protein
MKQILIAAFVILLWFACKKEKDDAPPPPTPEEMLSRAPWTKYSSLYKDEYMTAHEEQFTFYAQCTRDDKFVFYADKLYAWTQGPQKCPGNNLEVIESYTWHYIDSTKRLRLYVPNALFIPYAIHELTDSTLTIEQLHPRYSRIEKFRR